MVELATTAAHKQEIGNHILYKKITNAPLHVSQVFLQRNLKRVLDVHDYLTNEHSATKTIASDQNILTTGRLSNWEYPADEMSDMAIKFPTAPMIQLWALQIRSLGSSRRIEAPTRAQKSTLIPDWLPDPDIDLRVPCYVDIKVTDPTSPNISGFETRERGRIYGRHDENGRPYFDIELRELVEIPVDKLSVATPMRGGRWTRDLSTNHELEVSIHCEDSDDASKFLERLEPRGVISYLSDAPTKSVMTCKWGNFPDFPVDGQLIPLRKTVGLQAQDLEYGADLSMHWYGGTEESTLAQCNKKRQNSKTPQLPTPSASDDLEHALQMKRYTVRYSYQEYFQPMTVIRHHLRCLWCEDPLEYSSLHRLYLHYVLHHNHFHIDMESDSPEEATFAIQLAEKSNEAPFSHDPDLRHHWIAPSRPFNIDEYLKGDESWVNPGHGKGGKRGRAATFKNHIHHERPSSAQQPASLSITRPPLSEINVPPCQSRKKYPVPVIQGIKFYHETTKQAVLSGELLDPEEDDGAADDARLKHSQRRDYTLRGLTPAQQNFHEALNGYVALEQFGSHVLVRDGLVRFARKHVRELRHPEWSVEWAKKLQFLKAWNLTTDDVIDFCNDVVAGANDSGIGDDMEDRMDIDGEDAEHEEASPTRHRPNGVLTNGHRNDETPRRKNSHKWYGAGADRDIIGSPTHSSPARRKTNGMMLDHSMGGESFNPDHVLLSCGRLGGNRMSIRASDILKKDTFNPTSVKWEDLDYARFTSLLRERVEFDRNKDSLLQVFKVDNHTSQNRIDNEVEFHAALQREDLPEALFEGNAFVQFIIKDLVVPEQCCFCKDQIRGPRTTMVCDNPSCLQPYHHIKCTFPVKDYRKNEWQCRPCEALAADPRIARLR